MKKKRSSKKSSKKLSNKNSPLKNYWAISTIVLAVLLVATFLTGGTTGAIVSQEEAGQNLLNFITEQGAGAEIINTEDDGSLYTITLSIEGQEIPVYVTRDGKSFINPSGGLIPLEQEARTTSTQPAPTTPTFSEEDNLKIQEFSSCLAEKDFKVYGAAWCGHCQMIVETFGGEQNMEGVFIECSDANRQPTEHAQLCSDQEITVFPTMKLENEVLQIPRTLESIAEATGCPAPQLA